MTTEIEIKDAFSHFFKYAFSVMNEHIESQSQKRQTSYSIYMKEQHEILKDKIPNMSLRSKTISNNWKEVKKNKEEFSKYENQALNQPKVGLNEVKEKQQRIGGLNSYTLYCKVERDKQKKNGNNKLSNTKELAEMWKQVSEEKKEVYKNVVNEYNIDNDYEKAFKLLTK